MPSASILKRFKDSSAISQPRRFNRPVVTMSRPTLQIAFSLCRVAAVRDSDS